MHPARQASPDEQYPNSLQQGLDCGQLDAHPQVAELEFDTPAPPAGAVAALTRVEPADSRRTAGKPSAREEDLADVREMPEMKGSEMATIAVGDNLYHRSMDQHRSNIEKAIRRTEWSASRRESELEIKVGRREKRLLGGLGLRRSAPFGVLYYNSIGRRLFR